MEPAVLTAILGSSVLGALFAGLIGWLRDASQGRVASRRAEVDRAIAERDTAAATAEAADDALRIVREELFAHRRLIIDAPCLGPSNLPALSDAARGTP